MSACRHGRQLSNETLRTLRTANDIRVSWAEIARRCGIGRSTLYRLMCGGLARERTARAVEGFAERWRRADDAFVASMVRRWSAARRAAGHHRKPGRAA